MEKPPSVWRWTWKTVTAKFICLRWGGEMSWPCHSRHWSLLCKMLDLLGSGWEQISLKVSIHCWILDWLERSVGVGVQGVFGGEYNLGFVDPSTGETVSYWHPFDLVSSSVRGNSNSVFQAAEILWSHIRKTNWLYSLPWVCYFTIMTFCERRSQGSETSHPVLWWFCCGPQVISTAGVFLEDKFQAVVNSFNTGK